MKPVIGLTDYEKLFNPRRAGKAINTGNEGKKKPERKLSGLSFLKEFLLESVASAAESTTSATITAAITAIIARLARTSFVNCN